MGHYLWYGFEAQVEAAFFQGSDVLFLPTNP